MNFKVVSVLCATLLAVTAAGQQNTGGQTPPPKAVIEGVVTKAGTSQPLKGARISIRKADTAARPNDASAATTDVAGKFTLSGLDAGQYRVFVERDGYI